MRPRPHTLARSVALPPHVSLVPRCVFASLRTQASCGFPPPLPIARSVRPISFCTRATPRAGPEAIRIPRPPSFRQDVSRRAFHPSRRRHDVFFASFPALKSGLLSITRVSLVFLPFVFRYKLWKKYKRTAWLLIQIPIFALCIVFALGLDQSPRTGRWRLLLMSEGEEIAWSRRKHADILHSDGPLLLPPSDARSERVARITTRLITALEEQDHHVVSGASWPPRSQEPSRVIAEREAFERERMGGAGGHRPDRGPQHPPSGTARSTFMPFRPASSNPLKQLEAADWNIYVVDSPAINAFCLPSKDVFVYTGLLETLPEDDAMLAAVLGHEIAHVMERHSVENLGFLNVAAVAFDVLRGISFALTISFPFITDSAGLFINYLNDIVAQRAYSRKLEEEADVVGLRLMATAGFDPRAALDLWELMGCVEEDAVSLGHSVNAANKFGFLRTHPTSEARLEMLEKDMPGAMRTWREHLPRRAAHAQVQVQGEDGKGKDAAVAEAVADVGPVEATDAGGPSPLTEQETRREKARMGRAGNGEGQPGENEVVRDV